MSKQKARNPFTSLQKITTNLYILLINLETGPTSFSLHKHHHLSIFVFDSCLLRIASYFVDSLNNSYF